MAAEYFAQEQNVALNTPIVFNASIPCNKGYVFHEDGTGVFTLTGKTYGCSVRYKVSFTGNIAIPEGGTVTPIALAISSDGETRPYSISIFTPAAVDEFGNVKSEAIITVPRGCCKSMAVRYVDATANDPATAPTNTITVSGNLTIDGAN